MKLMYETEFPTFEQEINEATGEKKYKITGIYSSPGKKNKNGREYPMSIWEREVEKYQDVIKSGSPNSLMELDHPPYTDVNMMEAVAKINKLWIENGFVMGEAVLLNNPKANQLKTLIDNGIKMAVSTRGVGKVGSSGLVEEYRLITVDVIPNLKQSDHQAEMFGISEGILTEAEFDIVDDNIVKVCTKDKCLMENREKVNEGVLAIFSRLLVTETKAVKEADEVVAPEEGKEAPVAKKPVASTLPVEVRRLSVDNLVTILQKLIGADSYIKVKELISLLKHQEDQAETFDVTVLKDIYNQVLSKKYLAKGE